MIIIIGKGNNSFVKLFTNVISFNIETDQPNEVVPIIIPIFTDEEIEADRY